MKITAYKATLEWTSPATSPDSRTGTEEAAQWLTLHYSSAKIWRFPRASLIGCFLTVHGAMALSFASHWVEITCHTGEQAVDGLLTAGQLAEGILSGNITTIAANEELSAKPAQEKTGIVKELSAPSPEPRTPNQEKTTNQADGTTRLAQALRVVYQPAQRTEDHPMSELLAMDYTSSGGSQAIILSFSRGRLVIKSTSEEELACAWGALRDGSSFNGLFFSVEFKAYEPY